MAASSAPSCSLLNHVHACSGKTAAYLVPALAHIRDARRKAAAAAAELGKPARGIHGASALVLAPTRELARQIQQEALKFGAPLGLRTA